MRIQFSKFALAAIFGFAITFTFSCSGGDDQNGGTSSPSGSSPSSGGGGSDKGNDIANYKTVPIGDQVWMAENLNYNVKGSKCYDNKSANCDKYGRLYDWATAMALDASCNDKECASQIKAKHQGICPSGWHIPSDDDWDELENLAHELGNPAEGKSTEGTKLKSKSGWNNNGNGTDELGFSALPGGLGYSGGSFEDVGNYGYWWSSEESGPGLVYILRMSYDYENVNQYTNWKSFFRSVRCLQD